jgi:TonB-dependent SusC/RagA subfamily outer membrane receptor
VLKDAASCAGFGSRGANGVIVIYTKIGDINREEFPPFHIKTMLPLGYQPPVEFYAPKYDTPEKRKAPDPDLRTTIHWQPVVQTDTFGEASFEFYTADEPIAYTVVIEGLTADGRIIRQEKKLSWR